MQSGLCTSMLFLLHLLTLTTLHARLLQLAEQNLSPEEWTKREVKVKIMRDKKLPKVILHNHVHIYPSPSDFERPELLLPQY